MRLFRLVLLALAACLASLGTRADNGALKAVTIASGLSSPWGIAFLPDARMLVTEKGGTLRIVSADGKVGAPLAGVPAVDARGQGGLLGVALDPKFADNRLVYLSFSEPGEGRSNGTAVVRGRLDTSAAAPRLADVQLIFRQQPKVASTAHFGSRLVFGDDGRLFVTLGDRFSRMQDAQSLDNHLGKVVRIEADGGVPADNPFVGKPGARPEIWSLGHRNVQGVALDPTGALWTLEHGPQGGDEVNLDLPGRNYGWPVITYGVNYVTGTKIGEGTHKPGMEQPLKVWVPSIAPSAMTFLTSDRYPGWKGNLFVSALRGELLARLTLDGAKVVGEERLLEGRLGRIRDIVQGPDGWLYLLTDGEGGRIVRLER